MSPRRFAYREILRGYLRNHIPALAGAPIDLAGCDRASAKDFHEIRAVFTRGVA
jgi:hypothetical protein